MITVHLSDGGKITKDTDRLRFFFPPKNDTMRSTWTYEQLGSPKVEEGCITINLSHVVDMRPADEIERKHAEIHGW